MKLSTSVLDLDLSEIEKRITRFIKTYVENAGVNGIVVGLSGGIDSGTIAALSSRAIGGDKVLGLLQAPLRLGFKCSIGYVRITNL